jgi:regulator of replication initiation timing
MKAELEKEIERLHALLAIQDDAIMHLRERLLEAHSDTQRRVAEASTENARLRRENEQLRERRVEPCR